MSASRQCRESQTPADVVSVEDLEFSGHEKPSLLGSFFTDCSERVAEPPLHQDGFDGRTPCSTDVGSSGDEQCPKRDVSLQGALESWGIPNQTQDLPARTRLNPGAAAWRPRVSVEQAAFEQGTPTEPRSPCHWHTSSHSVGVVSADGHVFTKTDNGQNKTVINPFGNPSSISSICMVFEATLRSAGTHVCKYTILRGTVGKADGVGFVFDSAVRRRNIQKMCALFVNKNGCICFRDQNRITKLNVLLPALVTGLSLTLYVDLDQSWFRFVAHFDGMLAGYAEISLNEIATTKTSRALLKSGFFCAVVTKDISVSIE